MTRPKTKRIVWTLAVLLALSFVAAIFLLKSPKPEIIGDLSKKEVAEISRAALRDERGALRVVLGYAVRHRKLKESSDMIVQYPFIRVIRIEVLEPEEAVVTTQARFRGLPSAHVVNKIDGHWKVLSRTD